MIQNHQGEMDVFLLITSLSTITGFLLMRRILESIYGWELIARGANLEKKGGTWSPIPWFPGWAEGARNESITNGLWIYQSYRCNETSIKTQKEVIWRASRLRNQNTSISHHARPHTPRGQKLLHLKPCYTHLSLHLAVDLYPSISL